MARSSGVEHYLDTVGVGGSKPLVPTKTTKPPPGGFVLFRGWFRTTERQWRAGRESEARKRAERSAKRIPVRSQCRDGEPWRTWFETTRANQSHEASARRPCPFQGVVSDHRAAMARSLTRASGPRGFAPATRSARSVLTSLHFVSVGWWASAARMRAAWSAKRIPVGSQCHHRESKLSCPTRA